MTRSGVLLCCQVCSIHFLQWKCRPTSKVGVSWGRRCGHLGSCCGSLSPRASCAKVLRHWELDRLGFEHYEVLQVLSRALRSARGRLGSARGHLALMALGPPLVILGVELVAVGFFLVIKYEMQCRTLGFRMFFAVG